MLAPRWTVEFVVCLAALGGTVRGDGEEPPPSAEVLDGAADADWECERPGRFVNPADPSCRTYVTCVPAEDAPGGGGGLTRRLDECGAGALFSGRYQRCIAGSDCAALADFYAIEYACAECGKFVLAASADCRQFVNCLKTRDAGVFVPIRQSCPAGKLFSGAAHGCVDEDTFECSPATTTTVVAAVAAAGDVPEPGALGDPHRSDFVCLGPGRFPDESVPHCRGYRWCIDSPQPGQFVSRNFLCDAGRVFSEDAGRCVPSGAYRCPDDGDGAPERFRCAAVGRFPERGARGCERYYHCQETAGGTLKALLERCPAGTVFSWLTTRCVPSAEYVCPVEDAALRGGPKAEGRQQQPEEEEEREEQEEQEEEEEDLEEPVDEGGVVSREHRRRCSRSGRFANDADALCRTYFICTRDARGAWAKVLVRCPAGTVFSRAGGRCVGAELEPCAAGPRPPVEPPPPTTTQVASSSDDPEDPGCTDLVLPNPADRTCRTYFGCREPDRDALGGPRPRRLLLLACPDGALFSPAAGRCVVAGGARGADDAERDADGSGGEDSLDDLLPAYCRAPVVDPGSGVVGLDVESAEVAADLESPGVPPSEARTTTTPTTPTRTTTTTTTEGTGTGGGAGEAGGGYSSYSGPAPEYPCTATGRFADINSVDCRSYFLCKQQPPPGGSLVSVHLACPDGTVFSRNLNKCTVSGRHGC